VAETEGQLRTSNGTGTSNTQHPTSNIERTLNLEP
jgi:hypothetical protein